jgi:type I restriction enzyme, S subunit
VTSATGEIKKVPKGWVGVKLGDVCETTSGGTPSRSHSSFYVGSIPWVKSGELEYNTICKTEECISDEAIIKSSAKLLPKDTLLIALYGATVGKLAFLGVEAATNQAVCAIMPPEYLSRIFLYYYLFFSKEFLLNKRIGGAQPNISQGILRELEFPIPPLPEQHRIVAKIEELFSDLDAGIESLRKAKAQLKTYRQSVLKWAFEGKLTEEWRKKYPNQDYTDSGITTIQKKSGQSSNPINHGSDNLPGGWKWLLTEKVGDVSGGLTKNSKRELLSTKMPYLRVANVYANRLDLAEIKEIGIEKSEILRVLLQRNDLLVVEGNGSPDQIGRVAIWNEEIKNCIHQNHLIKVRPNSDAHPKHILYWYLSPKGRQQIELISSSTSGLHTLNISKIKSLPIPICSIQEQTKIVSEIESRLSVADNLEKTIDASLAQADALRQSILKFAFEGKLVPQDPNDEPAEKLLERIKNVRTADIRGLSDGADFKRKTKKKQNG